MSDVNTTTGTNVAPTRRWLTAITVVLCVFVGQSFARFTFGLLLPAMKKDLGISYGLAGWLGTINLIAYLVSTILTTSASLRVPPHRMVQFGVGLATVGITILASTRSTPLLIVGMICGGLGGAAAWIPAPGVIASVFPPEKRGLAMGMASAAIGGGIVLATMWTTGVRDVADNAGLWRPIWVGEAAFGAVMTVLALIVLRPMKVAPGSPPKISVLKTVPHWWAPTAAYACFGLAYVLFATFVVAALEQDKGFGKGHAVWVYALMGLGQTIGALVIGRLSDRIGRRTTMVASFAAAGVGALSVLIGVEPVVSFATFFYGLGMAGSITSIAAYIGDHIRPQDFGAAFGVVTTGFGITQSIGPRLGGWMADHFGSFTGVFLLDGAVWFAGAALAAFLPTARRRLAR